MPFYVRSEMAMIKSLVRMLASAVLLLCTTPHLSAQSYPNQSISLVLPYAPGDAGDVAGRIMAEDLAKHLKVRSAFSARY
jgi:tripartite-type tricarboxylate transporter receptor subunit TctC